MKNAIIFALLFALAILAFGTRDEAQAVIEDTTLLHHAKWVRLRAGLETDSDWLARHPPQSGQSVLRRQPPFRDYGRTSRVSFNAAATNAIASTNPADWQTCIVIPNGPIRRPDNYSAKPHGRRADSA